MRTLEIEIALMRKIELCRKYNSSKCFFWDDEIFL